MSSFINNDLEHLRPSFTSKVFVLSVPINILLEFRRYLQTTFLLEHGKDFNHEIIANISKYFQIF